jgi:hypothetical protein
LSIARREKTREEDVGVGVWCNGVDVVGSERVLNKVADVFVIAVLADGEGTGSSALSASTNSR